MIVTLEISEASKRLIERHGKASEKAQDAVIGALRSAVAVGAESVAKWLQKGGGGLTMRHPESGLAADVTGWMLDASIPLAAVGVPSNTPAARYAAMLEHGGTIRPRAARALAIPVSEEAKKHASPREMPNLFMVKRPGKPPLLAEAVGRRLLVHWLLVGSVRIEGRAWLSRGADQAVDTMREAFEDALNTYLGTWNEG